MTTAAPSPGSHLFLRPEDVAQDVAEGYYGRVVSVHDNSVLVEPIDGGAKIGAESISTKVALLRVVPDEEPTGSRSSALLRHGVAVTTPEGVRFGQVIMTNGLGVLVSLAHGAEWYTSEDVICAVHPLMAMVMFEHRLKPEAWTESFIRDADRRLMACVVDADEAPPTWAQALDAISPSLSVKTRSASGYRRWHEMKTGRMRVTTVDHAIAYTYYVDAGHVVPPDMQGSIGTSIADDSACEIEVAASPEQRPQLKKARTTTTFLASETSFDAQDEESKADDVDVPESFVAALNAAAAAAAGQPQVGSARTASRMRASNDPRESLAAVTPQPMPDQAVAMTPLQARALLRRHFADNPEAERLLQVALASAPPRRPVNVLSDATRKDKYGFYPIEVDLAYHEAMTNAKYQGTSPSTFVHRLLAASAVTFIPYPAVLALLYSFAFGPSGLSLMHLKGVTLLEQMALQRDQSINRRDFSTNAKLPDPARPRSWGDLQDAATGFVAYCNEYADAVTVQLAYTVAGFVSAMQAYGNWPENRLEALEFWINERLCAYRQLVDAELRTGVDCRRDALAWFAPTNPTLVPLQHLILREELTALQTAAATVGQHGAFGQASRNQGRNRGANQTNNNGQQGVSGIPTNISALIPKRNKRELCLRFASSRGCKSKESTCGSGDRTREHFVPTNLPPDLRAFITSRFGGLSSDHAGTA